MSLLSLRGLTKSYDGVRAVDDVSLEVGPGEVRALIGPNGAGKTTLVGLVCGRIAADAGQVVLDGQDITALPAHRRTRLGMAYTFQITSIYARLPVSENVALAARPHMTAGQVPGAVAQVIDQVGLTRYCDALAGDLSYGHQRLVEIAMGLVSAPRLLILDEPTQGLSEVEIAAFKDLIRGMAGRCAILLIEHNMDVVMALAERVTVLSAGALLFEGTPEEVRADPGVQAAYLGAP
ncbi:amino acid/amide ABC transporter ATP-binding protein 1, HAAT family [Roseovarius nanhaiticus]|uniref:Amino acid/amide ABC transporter ATP-binding protein 1, HAAT family n=1 Tax=Roseovarius nanhaiticus TaxID=573024 RepID=A0A1N7EAT1_9RHOB|nr:ABC transporter ATP-binding protein [Roseovarius nanhaiticus]SEK78459.1 amino acid/amide ABC transporter ATP-binding protein 1, HAAT family [Roseovarius nanhaiticus]SIR85150.1 amino acid/amide ABC transporter ATP-binding protein 1, HAAT family [Roseovarius nanhaiticus]